MSIIARRFSAAPERAASVTWEAITALICGSDSTARKEFVAMQGLAAASIAEEVFGKHPLVVTGAGPRLRVYCLYGEEAVTDDARNETALTWKPTDGEWTAYLPCLEEDFVWVDRETRAYSLRFVAYSIEKGLPEAAREAEESSVSALATQPLAIDPERFKSL